MVNEKNKFIAQICHIAAAEAGGERFDAAQTDEERRGYNNLLILCYPHHVETDDQQMYPTGRLQEMKARHEKTFGQTPFKIDESLLYKISHEMEQYWQKVARLHSDHHVALDLAIEINAKASFSQLAKQARVLSDDVTRLRDILLESDDALSVDLNALLEDLGISESSLTDHQTRTRPFHSRNWEVLNLGFTNSLTKLNAVLSQMEIKYLEEFLKLNPNDTSARLEMERLKSEFEALATYAGYAD
nr:hypothetical protein [uncultured Albidiferax sp.]